MYREHAGDDVRSQRYAGTPTVTSAHPQGHRNTMAWPAQPPDPAPSRKGQRRRNLAWVAAVIAVAGIAAVAALLHRHTSVQVAGGQHAALVSPSHSSSAGIGWTTYQDPSGFSIKLPPGWAVISTAATEVRFTGPQPGFVVLVAWTTHPQPDQLADWRQQAASKAQSDPTYQQIGISRTNYRGYNAADWEFTNMYHGQLTHVLDHGFVVTPGQLAYAIELYGPDAGWSAVHASIWQRLLQTFTPAP